MEKEHIKFIYNEAAVVVTTGGKGYLVIGDIHIGAEQRFMKRGIHLYNTVEVMTDRIKRLMKDFGLGDIIILGDVKDSILYPQMPEMSGVKRFFEALRAYNITITLGNHDAHLGDIVNCKMVEELIIENCAFMHGHRWPSENAMNCDYIFAGHNHAAVSIEDENGGYYNQKAWFIAPLDKKKSKERYPNANVKIKLVILPAFNDLIIGTPVNDVKDDNLSPLFRNGIFDYKKGKVYSLRGDMLGVPSKLKPPARKTKSG